MSRLFEYEFADIARRNCWRIMLLETYGEISPHERVVRKNKKIKIYITYIMKRPVIVRTLNRSEFIEKF